MRRYPARPWVGIGVVLLQGDAVLLARRGQAPALGEWSLPGGVQQLGESCEDAARRELAEETGLRVGALALLGRVDLIHRDALGRVKFHYTILDFGGWCAGGELCAGDDVSEVVWAKRGALGAYGLRPAVLEMIEKAERILLP